MENNKEQYWKEKIIEWEKSGLSQNRFCEENKIRLSTFQYWRGKFIQVKNIDKLIPVVIQDQSQVREPIITIGLNQDLKFFIRINFKFDKVIGWPEIKDVN